MSIPGGIARVIVRACARVNEYDGKQLTGTPPASAGLPRHPSPRKAYGAARHDRRAGAERGLFT